MNYKKKKRNGYHKGKREPDSEALGSWRKGVSRRVKLDIKERKQRIDVNRDEE